MPKYRVVEDRISKVEYEIEADTQKDAEARNGNILTQMEIDNYGYELISCEEVDDE